MVESMDDTQVVDLCNFLGDQISSYIKETFLRDKNASDIEFVRDLQAHALELQCGHIVLQHAHRSKL